MPTETTPTTDDSSLNNNPPKELIDALVSTVTDLHTLSVIVEDFTMDSQQILNEKINSYIANLANIEKLKDSSKASIPVDILSHLDNEKQNNPEIFTRKQLEECRAESKAFDSRLKSLHALKTELEIGMREMRSANV